METLINLIAPKEGELQKTKEGMYFANMVDEELDPYRVSFENDGCVKIDCSKVTHLYISSDSLLHLHNLIEVAEVAYENGYTESINESEDWFEKYDKLPPKVYKLLMKMLDEENSEGLDYPDLKQYLAQFEKLGWTFDYDLDASPYNLHPMNEGKN
jgi:hypothetical protein